VVTQYFDAFLGNLATDHEQAKEFHSYVIDAKFNFASYKPMDGMQFLAMADQSCS